MRITIKTITGLLLLTIVLSFAAYSQLPATGITHPISGVPSATASAVIDGKLYLLQGASLSIYDSVSGNWSTGASIPAETSSPGATAIDGKFYIVGGTQPDGSASDLLQIYDPATDSWTSGAMG